MTQRPTPYQALKQAGCTIDNHASDLHVLDTPKATEIIRSYPGCKAVRFISRIDGSFWWELPFLYDPFWEKRS